MAVKAVAEYTFTIKTASGSALVTVNGKEKTIDTTGVEMNVKAADSVKVVVTAVSGDNVKDKTTAKLDASGATLWNNEALTWTVNGFSADETLTITLAK